MLVPFLLLALASGICPSTVAFSSTAGGTFAPGPLTSPTFPTPVQTGFNLPSPAGITRQAPLPAPGVPYFQLSTNVTFFQGCVFSYYGAAQSTDGANPTVVLQLRPTSGGNNNPFFAPTTGNMGSFDLATTTSLSSGPMAKFVATPPADWSGWPSLFYSVQLGVLLSSVGTPTNVNIYFDKVLVECPLNCASPGIMDETFTSASNWKIVPYQRSVTATPVVITPISPVFGVSSGSGVSLTATGNNAWQFTQPTYADQTCTMTAVVKRTGGTGNCFFTFTQNYNTLPGNVVEISILNSPVPTGVIRSGAAITGPPSSQFREVTLQTSVSSTQNVIISAPVFGPISVVGLSVSAAAGATCNAELVRFSLDGCVGLDGSE